MSLQIKARIERRTWYVNGKYLGNTSPFFPDAGETARELTGDFYGEWQGTRHSDGAAIVQADMDRAIEDRRMLLANHPDSMLGDAYGHPIKLGDWGEYRIITTAFSQLIEEMGYEPGRGHSGAKSTKGIR